MLIVGIVVASVLVIAGGIFAVTSLGRTLTSAASGSNSGINARSEIRVDEGIVPDTVGFAAFEAYQKLANVELRTVFITPEGDTVWTETDSAETDLAGLFVCKQTLLAGSALTPHSDFLVTVDADCRGITNPMLVDDYATAANVWSPGSSSGTTWTDNAYLDGWVFGYADRYRPADMQVMTRYGLADVTLAMITPIDYWCDDDSRTEDELKNLALGARDRLLPIGLPVRLMLAAKNTNDVFMHRLTSSGELADGAAPQGSANEQLIRTGYWIPDIFGVSDYDLTVDPSTRTWKVTDTLTPTTLEVEYRDLIITAANETRVNTANPIAACITAQSAYWLKVYEPYVNADVDAGGSGGVDVGGSGGGGCWVNGYWRGSTWVNGYYRSC